MSYYLKNFSDEELESEKWKPIFGYDGKYEVSDLGRVRSKKRGGEKILRPAKKKSGYLTVALCRNGKAKFHLVHRLVASAFVPNDNIFNIEVNHIDEDKTNNRASNLEWCDSSYNKKYNDLHHRRKTKRSKIKGLYNPNLNSKQNLENFRANGIDCSSSTVKRLRKDIGLNESRPKRSKIERLYNPNLNSKQNIEIFRANGIDCSQQTIWRLRKDLGLTRSYHRLN